MADRSARWPDNAEGAFYVDLECILCTVCSELAPENFRLATSEDHDVCYRQPVDEAQLAQCRAAMAECPVEAIGDDGSEHPVE